MTVNIQRHRIKKVCYIVGASRERSPRATKIAEALEAQIVDCPSKLRRYSTFPLALLIKLTFSSYDVVIVNNIPTHILYSAWLASKFRSFILIADFVNFWKYAVKKKFQFLSSMASRLERWIYRRLEFGLAITEIVAKSAREAGVDKVKAIYDAADHEMFKPSFNLNPVVLLAANLRKDEGIDIFLNAMKLVKEKVPDVKGLLAGAGEEDANLRRYANDLGLTSCVDFLGWVPHSEMPFIHQRASVGVASIRSISPFALPIKLLEYMSSGLAVVSSDTPAVQTIIENGRNGLLFPAGDSNALASLIIQVLLNKDLMKELQKSARNTVEAGLNWKSEAQKLQRFVDSILTEEKD